MLIYGSFIRGREIRRHKMTSRIVTPFISKNTKVIQRYEEFRKIENTPLKRTFVLYWQYVITYEK